MRPRGRLTLLPGAAMGHSSPRLEDDALAITAVARDDSLSSLGPPAHAPDDLERGTLVSRYVVLAKLGAGGMGVVFAAYDPELDRKVALKLLHPHLAAVADPFASHEARSRLLREAQALARLNHPHIVAIHDVGEHDGTVWLAMEYVEGETLTAWSRQPRTWREALDIMTRAARGLEAAHAAGLVHRDIKPDNIMVGADGRVRVMDLGLARALDNADAPVRRAAPDLSLVTTRDLMILSAQVTRAGDVMGTPAYMSPEQFSGLPVDARADVFSFCATLWEALTGQRPFAGNSMAELAASVRAGALQPAPRHRRVPGWLRRVCLQGLAVAPARRFPSMTALLAALARGQARASARKWLWGAAAVATLGAAAALLQQHAAATRVAACEAAGATIDAAWNDDARARVQAGIIATGLSYARVTADKVVPFLDAQALAWHEHRTQACLLADAGTLSADHLDRAVWCLDERRMRLSAVVTELAGADPDVARQAVSMVAALQPISPCTTPQALVAMPPPPPAAERPRADEIRATLSQARTRLHAGKYPETLELTRAALADARALAWPPMIAAALQLEGITLDRTASFADAEAASLAAYVTAARAQAWDIATLAAADLVNTIGAHQLRPAEARVWATNAEVAEQFAGDPLGLREADRLNKLANFEERAGAYADAKLHYERALAITEAVQGADHPDVAVILNNLAIVLEDMGDLDAGKPLYERALAILEHVLGPEHPSVAALLNNLAIVHSTTGEFPRAIELHDRALAIREKSLGPEHPDTAGSLTNLAVVRSASGELAEARALQDRAVAIKTKALGPDHPDLALSLDNLATIHRLMGNLAESQALARRTASIWETAFGPDHPNTAAALHNLASTLETAGDHAAARPLFERSLAIWEKTLGPDHPNTATALGSLGILLLHDDPAAALPLLTRAVAIYDAIPRAQEGEPGTHLALARALVRTGGDRSRALAEARKAADGYREAHARPEELADVDALLAELAP